MASPPPVEMINLQQQQPAYIAAAIPVIVDPPRKRPSVTISHIVAPSQKMPRMDLEPSSITNGDGGMYDLQSSPCTVETSIDADQNNYRRLSARDRKKTDFFTPEPFSDDSRPGSIQKHSRTNSVPENVRRALNFDQSSLSCVTSSASVKTSDTESVKTDDTEATSSTNDNKLEVPTTQQAISGPQPTPVDVSKVKPFPVGSLVWGKLPGYDWWPGCVISYNKKEMEKFKEELEMNEDGTEDDGSVSSDDHSEDGDVVAWIKWFGDNQLSLLTCRKLKSFSYFSEYFCPSKFKGLYKKAVFAVLKEAAKRCHVDALFKNDEKQFIWRFHCQTYNTMFKKYSNTTNGSKEGNDNDKADYQEVKEELPSCETLLSTNELFTSINEVNGGSPVSSSKKKPSKERGVTYLTGVEKELLEWAVKGFRPTGPQGFEPRPEFVQDVQIVPLDPKSEHDTAYSPSNTNGKRVKKDGRRGITRSSEGGGADGNKVMVIETKNKAQFQLVAQGQIDIEDICLGCGRSCIVAKHPLFHGGLCTYCKDMFMECAYLFDEDGTQMYCTICSAGNEVFMCDTPNCSKVYCGICIEKLCGQDEYKAVSEAETWQCYMCSTASEEGERAAVGLMKLRENWDKELHDLFINDNEMEFEPPRFYPPICAEDRKSIRVLGLFDGIGTGLLVLKDLGIEVDLYISSEIDPDAIKVSRVNHGEMRHVGAIEYITEKEVKAWGPFDLVIGGSPCNDLSIVNPARKGIYDGTGRLFFEFYRILNYAKPAPDDPRPFFWMFENVVSMRAVDKQIISRFLQCNPVIVDARDISAAHRARFFWGNLPGMNRPTVPLPSDRLTLQSCLEPNCFRTAQFLKLRTVTTKMNSIKQTKKALAPVRVCGGEGISEDDEDVLWCSEMERLFGFPVHYTDVANLGRCGRQRLLGKAWSVPVARHLLSPLKDYFKSRTTGIPSSVKFGSSSVDNGGSTVNNPAVNADIKMMTASSTMMTVTGTVDSVTGTVDSIPPPCTVEPAAELHGQDEEIISIEVSAAASHVVNPATVSA